MFKSLFIFGSKYGSHYSVLAFLKHNKRFIGGILIQKKPNTLFIRFIGIKYYNHDMRL